MYESYVFFSIIYLDVEMVYFVEILGQIIQNIYGMILWVICYIKNVCMIEEI